MSKTTVSSGEVQYRTTPNLKRADFLVSSDPGIEVFVRSVIDPDTESNRVPVLLLHGARAPGIASFDLDVPNGSLAASLAQAGHPVYLMDARGYGDSTRQPDMQRAPDESEPLSRSVEVVRDVAAVVDHVRTETGTSRVALMGWATGSQWLAHFASEQPERTSHLILYNAVWPVRGAWAIGDNLADPESPDQLKPGALSGYGFATADALLGRWDASVPIENRDDWRHPDVAEAYAKAALASDPTALDRSPPSIRTPLGALADTFELSRGRRQFDPFRITARVLIIRSELDFWSRDVDFDAPINDLVSAKDVQRAVIPNATHFAHLDRPERGRQSLLDEVTRFLVSGAI